MNSLVLFSLLCMSPPDIIDLPPNVIEHPVKVEPRISYSLDDFHTYDEFLKLHGLPLAQKIFISPANNDEFITFSKKLSNLVEIKAIHNQELKGSILSFADKASTLRALNACLKEGYKAYPVVIYDDVEMVVLNEVIVNAQSSAKKSDYVKRLNKVAEIKFDIREIANKVFLIDVKEFSNPSNVLVLSNLISQDSFWVKSAMPVYVPLNGYISATATIETPSYTNLGQNRVLKVEINVFDPKINVRLDLLPQMGTTLIPNPYNGENWYDVKPPEISEVKTATRRIITVLYPFKNLQYGFFNFRPIMISYEKNDKLMQVETNGFLLVNNSVTMGTDIADLQPESYTPNLAKVVTTKPLESKNEYLDLLSWVVPSLFAICGGLLLSFWFASLIPMLTGIFESDVDEQLWEDLEACLDLDFSDWRADYATVSSRLNKVLVRDFNVSFYSLTTDSKNFVFTNLLNELNKLYMPEARVDVDILTYSLDTFCEERKIT